MTTLPDTRPDLADLAVRWLDALLDSADVATIGVANWWPRATAALATAAATCDTYGHAVAVGCRKLQIGTLTARSAQALAALEPAVAPHLAEWAALAERDAEYLVALTRVLRDERKPAKKTPAKTPAAAGDSEEPMF